MVSRRSTIGNNSKEVSDHEIGSENSHNHDLSQSKIDNSFSKFIHEDPIIKKIDRQNNLVNFKGRKDKQPSNNIKN